MEQQNIQNLLAEYAKNPAITAYETRIVKRAAAQDIQNSLSEHVLWCFDAQKQTVLLQYDPLVSAYGPLKLTDCAISDAAIGHAPLFHIDAQLISSDDTPLLEIEEADSTTLRMQFGWLLPAEKLGLYPNEAIECPVSALTQVNRLGSVVGRIIQNKLSTQKYKQ